MRKENKLMRFTTLVVLVAMLSLCLVSGTYAKYTSEFAGSDTVIVAKWDVSTSADANTATVNLFDESKIYDMKDVDYTNPVVDTDVATGTDKAIIAPGTWGTFAYTVANNSQVNATYSTTYTVTGADDLELEFTTDLTTGTWGSLTDVTDKALAMGDSETVNVYWRWSYGEDRNDNDVATGSVEPTVTIKTVFTQVD